ncbi:SMP-30/gluconolactonase/LRE family protein [Planctomycetota bacterium]
MKNAMISAIVLVNLIVCCLYNCATAAPLTQAWATDVNQLGPGPEAVVHDAIRDVLYVSHVNLNVPKDRDKQAMEEFISKVSIDGKVIKRDWIAGVNRPTGMVIYQDKLYVVERGALVVINLKKATIEKRIRIEDTGFLNDVTVDTKGVFYLTDSGRKAVVRIENDKAQLWLAGDKIAKPNGILCDGDKLVIGVNSDNCLKSIDLQTQEIKTIASLGAGGIDGILKYGEGYLVSHVAGNIYEVNLSGKVTELLNTREMDLKIADFGFIPNQQLIVAPIINKDILIGYTINPPAH